MGLQLVLGSAIFRDVVAELRRKVLQLLAVEEFVAVRGQMPTSAARATI